MNYDASEVKEEVKLKIEEVVRVLLPEARRQSNTMAIGGIDGESGQSMRISLNPSTCGAFTDFSTGDKGDIFILVQRVKSMSYSEAVNWLGENFTNLRPVVSLKSRTKSKSGLSLTDECIKLNDYAIQYLVNERGISEEILPRFRVYSSKKDPENALVYVTGDDKSNLDKTMTKVFNGEKKGNIYSSAEHRGSLWGKENVNPEDTSGVIIIAEGQEDAMSWATIGLPAVSVPSGASSRKWIEDEYEYLQQFHTIYLSFDNDKAGELLKDEVLRRLGHSRCKVINLPEKDANDTLRNHGIKTMMEAFEAADYPPPSHMLEASQLEDDVWDVLSRDPMERGKPFFLETLRFKVREHESTFVFGFTSHGKSEFIQNQVAFAVSQGERYMIASFEQSPQMTLSSILKCHAQKQIFQTKEELAASLREIQDNIFFYSEMSKPKPEFIVDQFVYAYKRYGVRNFVLDNIMTLDINIESLQEQAKASELFRMFVRSYPVHLFALAHPRKGDENGYLKPPMEHQIRGASEWQDMAHNIICVWRNKEKEENMQTLINANVDYIEVQQLDEAQPDSKCFLRKSRFQGNTDHALMWFDNSVKTFYSSPIRQK